MDGLIAYALSKKYADEVGRSIVDAGFKTQVEQDRSILQTTGQEKILYFIPKTTAKPSDGYDEYVYSNNAWEQIGVTDVDLSSIDYNSLRNKPTINGNVLMAYPMNNSAEYLGLQKKLFDGIKESEIDRAIEVGNSKDNGFYALLDSNSVFNGSVLFQYKFYGYYPMTGSSYGQYNYAFYQFKFPRINTNGEITEPPMYRISVPNIDGSMRRIVTDWMEISGGSEIASGVVNQNGTISFYDADGNLLFTTTGASVIGPKGDPGNNYVLTAQDKADIANIVLQELPTTQGVLYGNASN